MRKSSIQDADLCEAVTEMMLGLTDASLGSGLVKKRLARPGGGKRSGLRAIVALGPGQRYFFILGFPKNRVENMEPGELLALRGLASYLLAMTERELELATEAQKLEEICHEH